MHHEQTVVDVAALAETEGKSTLMAVLYDELIRFVLCASALCIAGFVPIMIHAGSIGKIAPASVHLSRLQRRLLASRTQSSERLVPCATSEHRFVGRQVVCLFAA